MSKASLSDLFEDALLPTELVNIKTEVPGEYGITQRVSMWLQQSDRNVYIGRGSDLGNPFSHLPNSAAKWQVQSREEAIEQYPAYILSRPELMARIGELSGKRLGCWCVPKRCHGDFLIRLVNQWQVQNNQL